jgi:tetratricopeptide (TPR) repeat protein
MGLAVCLGLWWLVQSSGGEFGTSLAKRVHTLTERSSRIEIWRAAIGLFREHPLVGCGLDAFQIAFGSKRTVDYWRIEWDLTPAKAHNEVLHILATQGILGGAALAILTAGLIQTVASAWRKASGDSRLILLAASAGVIGFYAQNLFSFTVAACGTLFVTFAALLSARCPARADKVASAAPTTGNWFAGGLCVGTLLSLAIFIGNVVAGSEHRLQSLWICCLAVAFAGGLVLYTIFVLEQRKHTATPVTTESGRIALSSLIRQQCILLPHRLIPALFGASSLLVVIYWVLWPYRADMACCKGDQLLNEDAAAAMRNYERAVALVSQYDVYWLKLAAGAQWASHHGPNTDRRFRLVQARQALERAVQLVPADPANHANLGRVLAELAREGWADSKEALQQLNRAIAADPNNAEFLAAAGRAALAFGQRERARQYYTRGLVIDPDNACLRAGLGAVAFAEQHWREAQTHLAEAFQQNWHGDEDGLLHAWVLMSAACLQLKEPEQAERATRLVLQRRPHWPEPHVLLARSLEMQGKQQAAIAEYREIQAQFPGHAAGREALARLKP